MDQTEFAELTRRTYRYRELSAKLERFQQAVEDLKIPNATLRFDIGGARSTFQTYKESETEPFRDVLLEAFRNEVSKLKHEIGSI